MIVSAAICIGTAVLVVYMLGRFHGMSAAFESLRPSQTGDWGRDVRTIELANSVSHFGTNSTGGVTRS